MESFISSLSIAISAIFTNKTRSFLTMLGVIIGVGSVILLTAIGNGLQAYVKEQFASFGATNVYVFPGDIFGDGGGFNTEAQVNAIANTKLTLRDGAELSKLREYVKAVAPEYTNSAKVSFLQEKKTATIYGSTSEYFSITSTNAAKGRVFTQAESVSGARVVVVGYKIAQDLFGTVDPVGKKITIGSQSFRVVGVAEEKGGGFGGPSFDAYIYMPIVAAHRLFNSQTVTQFTVQVRSPELMEGGIVAIKKEMRTRYKEDEFSVVDQKKILETINQVLGALTAGLGGIAAISLVVGGIGILNIMLVSVIERTREIGLRKALGATPSVILTQFLIEAATLSVLGGLLGTGLAFLISLAINQFIPAKVTPDAVALAFGVSAAIGIVFGVIPARRASKLSPIEALRYE